MKAKIISSLLTLFLANSLFGAGEIDFSVSLPKEKVVINEPFALTATISWQGGPTKWVVKSYNGPALSGLREIAHSLKSRSLLDGEGSKSLQIHKFTFIADKEGTANIGPIELNLVAKGGEERFLTSKALAVNVHASWLASILASPKKMATAGAVLFALLFIVLFIRHRRRRLAEASLRDQEAQKAKKDEEEKISRPLAEMKDLLGDEDVKKLYQRSKELIILILEARGIELSSKEDEDIVTALSQAQLTTGQQKGLEKVVKDAHLVRFAGLRPESDEREQVYSRIADFAKPFLKKDDDLD